MTDVQEARQTRVQKLDAARVAAEARLEAKHPAKFRITRVRYQLVVKPLNREE